MFFLLQPNFSRPTVLPSYKKAPCRSSQAAWGGGVIRAESYRPRAKVYQQRGGYARRGRTMLLGAAPSRHH